MQTTTTLMTGALAASAAQFSVAQKNTRTYGEILIRYEIEELWSNVGGSLHIPIVSVPTPEFVEIVEIRRDSGAKVSPAAGFVLSSDNSAEIPQNMSGVIIINQSTTPLNPGSTITLRVLA